MDNLSLTITIIGLLCTVLGVCIGFLTLMWGKRKDMKQEVKDEAKSGASIETKLDYIQKGVDDIRLDIKSQARDIQQLKEKVIRVEESTKSAHHRIDKIEEEK